MTRRKVLLIEDEDAIAEPLAEALARNGFDDDGDDDSSSGPGGGDDD